MSEYAVVNQDGEVVNVILADKEFIESLPGLIEDSNVDTGVFEAGWRYYQIDQLEVKPSIGWKREGRSWVGPPPPPPLENPLIGEPTE